MLCILQEKHQVVKHQVVMDYVILLIIFIKKYKHNKNK